MRGFRIREEEFIGSAGFQPVLFSAGFQPVPLKCGAAACHRSQVPGWERPFWSKKLLGNKDFEAELRLKLRPPAGAWDRGSGDVCLCTPHPNPLPRWGRGSKSFDLLVQEIKS